MKPGLVFQVLVTIADAANGRPNRYSYLGIATTDDWHRDWNPSLFQSHTEKHAHVEALPAGLHEDGIITQPPTNRRPPPVRNNVVHLAEGVDVPESILYFIFDIAARTAVRGETKYIDISEIKFIGGKYAQHIKALDSLPDEQRRRAEETLCSELAQRLR